MESLYVPAPVISVAVEPKTKQDMDKLSKALQSLSEEDPTFRVSVDPETNQTVIAGMGELHLEILVDRMLREFKVEANIGAPQVAYRETIRQKSKAEGKFIRQSGGKGRYLAMSSLRWLPENPAPVLPSSPKLWAGLFPKNIFLPPPTA